MAERRASIDIGTNTAHLLIGDVDIHGNNLITILKKRHFILLAESGIKVIDSAAIDRLMKAMADFRSILDEYQIGEVRIVGTEALRKSTNGIDIMKIIEDSYGFKIKIISGQEEALFVFRAIRSSIDIRKGSYLIVDIGGGSTEFILCRDGQAVQIVSRPVGIARLYSLFHQTEPITKNELRSLHTFLNGELEELMKGINKLNEPPVLIGCAGTFEIFDNMKSSISGSQSASLVRVDRFNKYRKMVQSLNLADRYALESIPAERARYIAVAVEQIHYLLEFLKSEYFMVSRYSLKEGIILS